MNHRTRLNTITSPFFIILSLFCFGVLPNSRAVNPPPDGGYPGGNTAEGQSALLSLSGGLYNTGVGIFSLLSLTDGNFNTGVGAGTLLANTGDQNTATGAGALLSNTTGSENTANGAFALFSNTEGGGNTANGLQALFSNTTGAGNTAAGTGALFSNTTGNANTAAGDNTLLSNTTGGLNTAIGHQALLSNTTGTANTATGAFSLLNNSTNGFNNTANGFNALFSNTNGFNNTAIGTDALDSNSTGSGNTALGSFAGTEVTTASNVICIGTSGLNVDDSCFIGNIYSNVQPIVGTDPDSVTITSAGRLGRGNVSSRRYKHDIKRMEKASEVLYALKPVSFRYNKEYDATQTLAFGLIAEEVAEVEPDLIGRNPKGQPESVRYEQINAMLLNEFLKEHTAFLEEHRKVQKLEATVSQQEEQIKALAKGLDKVSNQIELSKAGARTIADN